MQKSIVHKFYQYCLLLTFCGLFAGTAFAQTLHLTTGQTVTGELVSPDDKGFIVKQPDGSFGDRIPWGKLSQDDLKQLQGNPKVAQFVEPFIEADQQEKAKRADIEIKPVNRLERPASRSLFAALGTTGIGILILLIIYGGNIYAAYEISIYRAQPAGLVCGVAAVAPLLGPIIFLSMPTKLKKKVAEHQPVLEETVEAAIVADQASAEAAEAAAQAAAVPAGPVLPPTKSFPRGQFTFNRRFVETQLPGYFAMNRPEADRDMELSVKAARGTYVAQRISRISPNEIYLQVQTGHATQEVIIPFVEIQEVQLKHKDA
jgi:hypothetical protein